MNIGGVEVGVEALCPCRFVAELSNAHNGSLTRAHRLVDAVATTGAEFVKFQCYSPDELCALRGDGPAPDPWGAQGFTMRALYEKARTPFAWLPELFSHARDVGLVPFSSVFGAESLAVLGAADCPAYKIARLDNTHRDLIQMALDTDRPVLVSSTFVDGAVAWEYADRHDTVGLMYCPPGYPAVVTELPWEFAVAGYLGLSSHCLDPDLPIAAVARGAKLIEMHVMLDDVPSELEANVSLTVSQFAAMVRRVRRVEEMLG